MNQVSFRTIPFQLEFSFEATTPVQLDLVLTQLADPPAVPGIGS